MKSIMFFLLLLKASFAMSEVCTDGFVEVWDKITSYDPASSQLTLDLSRGQLGECSYPLYLDVLAVQKDNHRSCKSRHSSFSRWKNKKIANNSTKIVMQFISGKYIFRIKKDNNTDNESKSCTPMKMYKNSKGDDIIDIIHSEACQLNAGSGAPECTDGALVLNKFNLPPCYIKTDYSMVDVYLYQVNGTKDCEAIRHWEHFDQTFRANSTHMRSHTNLRNLEFPMQKPGNYCFFLTMKDTYPRCTPREAGLRDKCSFNFPNSKLSNKPIACQPQLRKQDSLTSPLIIVGAVCVPILLCVTSLIIWMKLKKKKSINYITLFNRSTSVVSSQSNKEKHQEISSNNLKEISRFVLLYFPGELSDKDRDAILGENGALGKCGAENREIIVTDLCKQIEQDLIQDTGKIESDLANGRTRCILVLSPGIKQLFDHVGGGSDVDPLVSMDGAWRSILPPIAKHILDMRNTGTGGDMYGKVACVRFDDQDGDEGDQVQINPNKRFSLPSDAEELSLWSMDSV